MKFAVLFVALSFVIGCGSPANRSTQAPAIELENGQYFFADAGFNKRYEFGGSTPLGVATITKSASGEYNVLLKSNKIDWKGDLTISGTQATMTVEYSPRLGSKSRRTYKGSIRPSERINLHPVQLIYFDSLKRETSSLGISDAPLTPEKLESWLVSTTLAQQAIKADQDVAAQAEAATQAKKQEQQAQERAQIEKAAKERKAFVASLTGADLAFWKAAEAINSDQFKDVTQSLVGMKNKGESQQTVQIKGERLIAQQTAMEMSARHVDGQRANESSRAIVKGYDRDREQYTRAFNEWMKSLE